MIKQPIIRKNRRDTNRYQLCVWCGDEVYSCGLCKGCYIRRKELSLKIKTSSEKLGMEPKSYTNTQEIDAMLIREAIWWMISTLTEREKFVIEQRFGIHTDKDRTLEEVAKELDTTRERIRQIEAKALKKLRHPQRIKISGVKNYQDYY
jgi:RNA polymerase sigma factor (sigma-70 family)